MYEKKGNLNVIKLGIAFMIILFFNNYSLYSQNADEYKLKAVYILSFSLFTEWPDNASQNLKNKPFIITVFGENPFKEKLKDVIKTKKHKLKGRPIILKHTNKLEDITNSNIVFISSSERYKISKIISYIRGKPILTIGDTEGYANKGVMINMIRKGKNIKFDINLKEVKQSKIYISSRLLANANTIIK